MEISSEEVMCLLFASGGVTLNWNKREVLSTVLISISLPSTPIPFYMSCQQSSATSRLNYSLSVLPQISVFIQTCKLYAKVNTAEMRQETLLFSVVPHIGIKTFSWAVQMKFLTLLTFQCRSLRPQDWVVYPSQLYQSPRRSRRSTGSK